MTDPTTIVKALGVALAAHVPVLLWGAPGTGKTSAIRAMADAAGLPCETVIAAIREPSDFAGLPIVADGTVRFAPPQWARRLAEAGDGILFLDEISTAPPAVQAALLRVVLERTVGDLTLPGGIAVVAAANPPDQASDGWDLTPPLANRFCHLDWHVDAPAFAAGITGGWPARPPAPLVPGWEAQSVVARGLIAAFMSVRPSLAVAVPSDPAQAGRGWPSPRTWEMTARLWAATDVAGASADVRRALVVGALGLPTAVEFLSWIQEMDLPDPEDLLADPEAFVPPERGDRVYAVLSSVTAAVAARPSVERWLAAWQLLAVAANSTPDIAATSARALIACRPPDAPTPAEARLFIPVLRDAGLMSA